MNEIRVHVVKEADRANYSMRYVDPVTALQVKRTAGTADRKEAERIAHKWEAEVNEGRYQRPAAITWDDFRLRYESEKLASLAPATLKAAATAFNHFERVANPRKLVSVTSALMSRFQADLRKGGMKDTTLDAHLRHLRAAFSWAVSLGMLQKVPDMHFPKRIKGHKLMRGRPIAGEEYDRMIKKAPEVRTHDAEVWQRYLAGLWLSGLRLAESLALSWDLDAPFAVDLSGGHPRFRIYAEAEKGNRDRLPPMTPDFAQWLLETPEDGRHGLVFKINGLQTGKPMTPKRVARILTKIGERAGVVVDHGRKRVKEKASKVATGRIIEVEYVKYASAHDYRRAFGTRWAKRVMPAVLKLLMRHTSIDTTMGYYVDIDADDVAALIFGGTTRNRTKKVPL